MFSWNGKVSEKRNKLILKVNTQRFVKLQTAPCVHGVKDTNNTLAGTKKIKIVTDDITTKARLKTNSILRFDGEPFFKALIGFSIYWDYKNCQIRFCAININLNPINKIHIKKIV